jgi:hypothetical protein
MALFWVADRTDFAILLLGLLPGARLGNLAIVCKMRKLSGTDRHTSYSDWPW